MKKLLLSILGMILLIPSISEATNDEIVWEKDYPVLVGDDFLLLDGQNTFLVYSRNKIYELSISTGELQDSISFEDYFKNINKISITDDGRYLALSGDNPYLIIWDMVNKQIFKKFTKVIFEGDSAQYWKSVSISPDGTKLTAIAVKEFSSIVTELVVFDVETGEVILSENRNNMDKIGQEYYGPIWVSTEFSPSGQYMVTELSVNWDHQSGQALLDSVYIYKTKDYKVNNTLINNFNEKDISFSSYENVISSNDGNTLTIYNLDTKEFSSHIFESYIHHLLFSNNLKKMFLSIGSSKSVIYNYSSETIEYNVTIPFFAFKNVNDNIILGGSLYEFALFNANWDGISIVNQNNIISNIIYPNPSDSILNINFNVKFSSTFSYQIFDMNSNKLVSKDIGFLKNGNNTIKININSLPPQTYILKISSEKESFDFKIIKE